MSNSDMKTLLGSIKLEDLSDTDVSEPLGVTRVNVSDNSSIC